MNNQPAQAPIVKRLVLVGGGHSHLSVLMHLAMNPLPGLDVVLITREVHTPYSGALPGCIAGIYDSDSIHIDLRPLAQFAGARLIHQEVTRLDLEARQVLLDSRPPLRFDALSLNIGSRPDAESIPGARQHALGVKPIDKLLLVWASIKRQAVERLTDNEPYTLAIVGGGPASVELAFSAQHAINKAAGSEGKQPSNLTIRIVTADSQILKFHNNKVKDFTCAELKRRGIQLHFDHRVTEFQAHKIICDDKDPIDADSIIFATGAGIPQWPGDSGLELTEDGFIAVDTCLQSLSHPFVFACGDAASIEGHPRPKSGVFAVRHGKPIARNLVRFLTGRRLKPYIPQKHALALMYTGDRKAIASRRNLFFHGRWVWALKHRIDTAFMRKYARFPDTKVALGLTKGLTDAGTENALAEHALRCAGCAAKVGSQALNQALAKLKPVTKQDLASGPGKCEDAALITLKDQRTLVQSVDYFRAFINDPWLFARIASNHCLNDIYATGAQPHSALAIATIPFASQAMMAAMLEELMSGCVATLNEHDTALAGGHSNEGSELAFGLSVTGFAEHRLMGKAGAQAGDILILTKPLGTGTLLAADMRLKAQGRWIEAALEQMLISNRAAASCFLSHQASACTDVTGFGLAGHLREILTASRLSAELQLDSLPALSGAFESLQREIVSSLHDDNRLTGGLLEGDRKITAGPAYELLFDPQTAGGLLGCVPAEHAADCLSALHAAGYSRACQIGRLFDNADGPVIRLS